MFKFLDKFFGIFFAIMGILLALGFLLSMLSK